MASNLTTAASSLQIFTTLAQESTTSVVDRFQSLANERFIMPAEWESNEDLQDYVALSQCSPTFKSLDGSMSTLAQLVVTHQPGPVFVPMANTYVDAFTVELVAHPLISSVIIDTWSVESLRVTMTYVEEDDVDQSGDAGATTKKRKRVKKGYPSMATPTPKVRSRTPLYSKEYPFANKVVAVRDMSFRASACRPVRLFFETTATDALGRKTIFATSSHPFMILSNCNQWKEGLALYLRHRVFEEGRDNTSFHRLFNYLQLAYLATKGFSGTRHLYPLEVMRWMIGAVQSELRLKRDVVALEDVGVVSRHLFEAWCEHAGPIFYDLHTANTNKHFKLLWAKGYIGIGSVTASTAAIPDGHCRLFINPSHFETERREAASYLAMQTNTTTYSLLNLEKEYLAYFFEHSRNSAGYTHLVSVVEGDAVTIETIVKRGSC